MAFVRLGTIVATRGLKGELKIKSSTDFGAERYKKDAEVYLESETGEIEVVRVVSHSASAGFDYVFCAGIDTVEKALRYKGYAVLYPLAQLPPLKDKLYYHELLDSRVIENGKEKGIVVDVDERSRSPLLVVKTSGDKRVYIPLIPPFIRLIDTAAKKIYLEKWEGLFDDER